MNLPIFTNSTQRPTSHLFCFDVMGLKSSCDTLLHFLRFFYQLLYIFTLPSSTAFVVLHGCGFENWNPPRFCTSPDNIGRLFFSWHQLDNYNTLKFCLWKYTRAFALSTLSFRCRCSQGGKDQRNLNNRKFNFWGCSCHRRFFVHVLYWILRILQQICTF